MNAAVVREKYRPASWVAQAGNQSGHFAGRAGWSSIMLEHLAEIGFENGRRLLQLIGEAGQMLQLAHRLFCLSHALGRRVDLCAEEVRILAVDRHLGERLDFSLEAIQLD